MAKQKLKLKLKQDKIKIDKIQEEISKPPAIAPQPEQPIKQPIKKSHEEPRKIQLDDLITVRPKGTFKTGSAKDVQFWAIQELKGATERYGKKGFLEKYGTIISVVLISILVVFSTVYTMNKLYSITTEITAAQRYSTDKIGEIGGKLDTIIGARIKPAEQPILGQQ